MSGDGGGGESKEEGEAENLKQTLSWAQSLTWGTWGLLLWPQDHNQSQKQIVGYLTNYATRCPITNWFFKNLLNKHYSLKKIEQFYQTFHYSNNPMFFCVCDVL